MSRLCGKQLVLTLSFAALISQLLLSCLVVVPALCELDDGQQASNAAAVAANPNDNHEQAGSETAQFRHQLSVFKLPDFDRFKSVFRKAYKSILEELSRKRIFLAKVFRAFMSVIDFLRGKSSSYKSINQMSDWTRDEWRRTLNARASSGQARNLADTARANQRTQDENQDQELEERKHTDDVQVASAAQVEAAGIEDESDVKRKMLEAAAASTSEQHAHEKSSVGVTGDESTGEKKRRSGRHEVASSSTPPISMDKLADLMGASRLMIEGNEDEKSSEHKKRKSARAGGGNLPSANAKKVRRTNEAHDTTYSIDQRHCLNAPYNQGDCGSCYIWSSMSLLEWHYCAVTHEKTQFSIQFALDCEKSGSCAGGFTEDIMKFASTVGLERATSWPYEEHRGRCPFGRPIEESRTALSEAAYWKVSNLEWLSVPYEEWEQELAKGPIAMILATEESFTEYGGGVDEHAGCKPGVDMHSMLLVGRGREDGRDFWLLRNSYSDDWGEQGDYKISLEGMERCVWKGEDAGIAIDNGRLRFRQNRAYDAQLVEDYISKRHERKAAKGGKHERH